MWLHAVGNCPQLQALHHNARDATAAHLGHYVMLQSLSDFIGNREEPILWLSVNGLTRLTRLQHLHLTQCVLPHP